jgi:16S rRNA (uracil1498-N3)-methyltransferase
MSAHHFFVRPDDIDDGIVTISGDEARHAARVLRVRPGEAITVADDTGRILDAVVTDVGDNVRAEVLKETSVDEPRPALTLYQALTKGDKLDEIVQKATEVGVRRIVPFVAERSIVKWDASKRSKARERWEAVARSAAKQSGSPRLTVVDAIADGITVATDGNASVWVLHEADDATPLRRVLTDPAPETAALIVGPEGGLTDEEVGALRHGGADVVWLGPRILRTETAGIVAASIVAYAYGNLG